jgi:hypothetical protein
VEQQLPAGLSEGEIAQLIEDDEVEAREIVGNAPLPSGAGLGLELIDEIDGREEAPTRPARMQLRAMAIARWVLPVPDEPEAYCPISRRRWADLLSVSPSPRSERGDPEAAAFCRNGGVCYSPT